MAASAEPAPFGAPVDVRAATSAPARIALADVAPQPWRNGGGVTRELLLWPSDATWSVRISVADIAADGPFSTFPGVQRWFAVLEGDGVRLSLAAGDRRQVQSDPPLAFDGAEAPGCALLGGPTRDLNLMLHCGARGRMERAESGVAWSAIEPLRACYTAGPARWQGGAGKQTVSLPAHTLLHGLPEGPQWLIAEGPEPMLWIAVDPGGD